MYPAYLIRVGIDWVRHDDQFKDSNPYSRCEAAIKTCRTLWEQQVHRPNMKHLEPAVISAYWAEFFNVEDHLPDEKEWREGLVKQSSQYDSFEDWQVAFKKTFAKVFKEDNNIWLGVLMSSWAYTHQYDVLFVDDAWEFRPAASYLPTTEIWRLEPHMETVCDILKTVWADEVIAYENMRFVVDEERAHSAGKVECLGLDTKKYVLKWPPHVQRDDSVVEIDDIIADIIFPAGDDWYRHLDNVIFANNQLDVTALMNRSKYMLASKRRLYELSVDNDLEKAKLQARAEGWLVPKVQEAVA